MVNCLKRSPTSSLTAVKFLTLSIIKTLWIDLNLTSFMNTIKWITGSPGAWIDKFPTGMNVIHFISQFHQFYGTNIRGLLLSCSVWAYARDAGRFDCFSECLILITLDYGIGNRNQKTFIFSKTTNIINNHDTSGIYYWHRTPGESWNERSPTQPT